MIDYHDIYLKRLNRFGTNPQQRIQGHREFEFEVYLKKSAYRVTFEYNHCCHTGSFEKYKQDTTSTYHYLLTNVHLIMPAGTILMLPNKDHIPEPWMIFYLEDMKASGYNRYIMLKITDTVFWIGDDGRTHESFAYLCGPAKGLIRDIPKQFSPAPIYAEDENRYFFIMPRQPNLTKDLYIEIGHKPFQKCFRVVELDFISVDGIEYVLLDPIYKYDLSLAPPRKEEDTDEDRFWIDFGNIPVKPGEG